MTLGATHEQIAQHDVCSHELFRTPCCRRIASVLIYLGQPFDAAPCPHCAEPLTPTHASRLSVARLKSVALGGHECPQCGAEQLNLEETGRFT